MGLMLKQFKKPRTANEAIQKIFVQDVRKGEEFVVKERGWKFYVHLNKLVAPMERYGLIKVVGEKRGPTNRMEKIWVTK